MQQRIMHVKCDMCGAERDFGEHFNYMNPWRHKVLVEVHGEESHKWGYEEHELDLCPECYGRCVAIKAINHEWRDCLHSAYENHNTVDYVVVGTDYQWK